MIPLYIALSLIPLAVILFLNIKNKKAKNQEINSDAPKGTIYERERNIALNINPTLLKLAIPENETLIYGIVMDMDMGDGFISLACYITGAANLYFSKGGGLKGGGRNPKIGEAGVEFVTEAQEFLNYTQPIKIPLAPQKGLVQFYFLTNKGKYASSEQIKFIEDNSSVWLALFEKGSNVISEMHKGGN